MADVNASGTVENYLHDRGFYWTLFFNDTGNSVQIDAQHLVISTQQPASDTPQRATIILQDNTSTTFAVDCLTGKFVAPSPANIVGRDFSQTHAGSMLNAGPVTRTSVRLRVSTDRAAGIESSSLYTPPA